MSVEELPEYQKQLAEVEDLLKDDPQNEELLTMKATLVDLIETVQQLSQVAEVSEEAKAQQVGTEAVKPGDDEVHPVAVGTAESTLPTANDASLTPVPPASALKITREWSVNDRVISRWPEDGQYYLAKIERIISPDGDLVPSVDVSLAQRDRYKFDVLYLQYGNSSLVESSDLSPFEPPPKSTLLPGQVVAAYWPEDGLFYEAVIEGPSHSHKAEGGPQAKVAMFRVKFRHNRARSEKSSSDLYIPPEWQGKRVPIGGLAALTAAALSDDLDAELPGFVLPEKLKVLPSDSEAERKLKQLRARQLRKAYVLQSKEIMSAKKAQRWNDFQTKLKTGKLVHSLGAKPVAVTSSGVPSASSSASSVASSFHATATRRTTGAILPPSSGSTAAHATTRTSVASITQPQSAQNRASSSESRRQILHTFQRPQTDAQSQAGAASGAQQGTKTVGLGRSVFGDDDDD